MRGDPPLIGARASAKTRLSAIRPFTASEEPSLRRGLRTNRTVASDRYNRPTRTPSPRRYRLPTFKCDRRAALFSLPRHRRRRRGSACALSRSRRKSLLGCDCRSPRPSMRRNSSRSFAPGRSSTFPGPDGRIEGLDADLLRLYAAERKLPLRFVAIDNTADVLAALGGRRRAPRLRADCCAADAGADRRPRPSFPRRGHREAPPHRAQSTGPSATTCRAGADLQHRGLQARELGRSRRRDRRLRGSSGRRARDRSAARGASGGALAAGSRTLRRSNSSRRWRRER